MSADDIDLDAQVFTIGAQGAGASVLYPPGKPWRMELTEAQLHVAIRFLRQQWEASPKTEGQNRSEGEDRAR